MNRNTMQNEERIIFKLRELYGKYGYAQYKMSKFEEYDLYVRNKDFLISDSIITFTDTNGKLMALKPDVTLSIVKNTRDIPGYVQKLYYDENIYRVSRGSHSFRESMQVGLECIGEIDDYCIYEVLNLAAESLKSLSENCVLNISHLDVLSDALKGCEGEIRAEIQKCIAEKNAHELSQLCERSGMDAARRQLLEKLLVLNGNPGEVLDELRGSIGESKAFRQLEKLAAAFAGSAAGEMLRIDFSVTSDMNYYNGIAFKGFIEGVPSGVLSGGQYDRLMRKMNRKSGAIGFAVYLDQLERLQESPREFDVDTVLLYDENSSLDGLKAAVDALAGDGGTVSAQKNQSDRLRCRRLARYQNGEVEILEEYA